MLRGFGSIPGRGREYFVSSHRLCPMVRTAPCSGVVSGGGGQSNQGMTHHLVLSLRTPVDYIHSLIMAS